MTDAELLATIFEKMFAWADEAGKSNKQLGAVATLLSRVGAELLKEAPDALPDPLDYTIEFISLEQQRELSRQILGIEE